MARSPISEGGSTRLSPLTVTKLVEQALNRGGVVATRIEILDKTIRIAAPGSDDATVHAALPFEFWLDAGLLDYELELEVV